MASLGSGLRAVSNAGEAKLGDGGYGDGVYLARQQTRGARDEKPGQNKPDPAKLQRQDFLENESKGRPLLEMDNDSDLFENEDAKHSNADANLGWRRADPSISE